MNLAAFEAFVKVMETGSISLAADQLFITQPAVTKRIHSLEEYFGVKLFESAGRGVQATHAAHSLLPKVKNWLNELGDIHHTLSHEQGMALVTILVCITCQAIYVAMCKAFQMSP